MLSYEVEILNENFQWQSKKEKNSIIDVDCSPYPKSLLNLCIWHTECRTEVHGLDVVER